MKKKFKKGAASFYVVAFSTLILVIIAASFAAIIISEIARTSNDDLAQSAYDSALAGIEDAKLAYYNYQDCLKQEGATKASMITDDGNVTCGEIMKMIEDGVDNGADEKADDGCDMVADILGRSVVPLYGSESGEEGTDNEGNKGVLISESNTNNNMLQAYTCVKIKKDLNNVKERVSTGDPIKLLPVRLGDGVEADAITHIKISWGDSSKNEFNSKAEVENNNMLTFSSKNGFPLMPPIIAVTLIQTGNDFKFDSFDMSDGSGTNRGTIYLVPASANITSSNNDDNYIFASDNFIGDNGFIKSNDKTIKNKPFVVKCDDEGESSFACSVNIELAKPKGGVKRNDKTFMFAVSLIEGESTDFMMEFCSGEKPCTAETHNTDGTVEPGNIVTLSGMQIEIDSTGRANDLFRRVQTRLSPNDSTMPYPLYAIQLLDKKPSDSTLMKDLSPNREWNF